MLAAQHLAEGGGLDVTQPGRRERAGGPAERDIIDDDRDGGQDVAGQLAFAGFVRAQAGHLLPGPQLGQRQQRRAGPGGQQYQLRRRRARWPGTATC